VALNRKLGEHRADYDAFGEERISPRKSKECLNGSVCGLVAMRTDLSRLTTTNVSYTDFILSDST
jgi:hypothetical protein